MPLIAKNHFMFKAIIIVSSMIVAAACVVAYFLRRNFRRAWYVLRTGDEHPDWEKFRRRLLYCFLGEARPKGLCYERGSKREESFRVGRSCCSVAISLRAAVRHSFDSVRFPRTSVLAAVLASEQLQWSRILHA